MLAYGAHLVKNGLGPVVARLVQEGWVTHLATNGAGTTARVPGIRVAGPLDIVGAGDACSAAISAALAAGAQPVEAATIATLAASITVQQLGTTGTATPAQLRRRLQEVRRGL